jgi:ribose transport system permease protein
MSTEQLTTPTKHGIDIFRRTDAGTLGYRLRDLGIVASFLLLFIGLSVSNSHFLTKANVLNVLDQWSGTGMIAATLTLVFVAGVFDVSVGATFALAGVVAAMLANAGLGAGLALFAGIAAGGLCGAVNGALTAIGRINAFIATLATSIIIGGLATVLTGGNLITVANPGFSDLGNMDLFGVTYAIWLMLLIFLGCGFLLWRTSFGRALYACGGNAEAARMCGIRVGAVRGAAYVLVGLAAGVAGVAAASQVGTGEADVGGVSLAFDAITAVVIGGTSIMGGEGALWRTALGLLILAMIGDGFALFGLNSTYQDLVTGCVILLAVAVDAGVRRTR